MGFRHKLTCVRSMRTESKAERMEGPIIMPTMPTMPAMHLHLLHQFLSAVSTCLYTALQWTTWTTWARHLSNKNWLRKR
jgi:hypothetical protein